MDTITHEALSHGLRTPLTSVLGYSATLIDQWDDLGEQDRILFVHMVYNEALRMAHSVEQVDRQLYHEFAAGNARSDALQQPLGIADAS